MIHNSFHVEAVVVIELTLAPVQWGDRWRWVRIARTLEAVAYQV
jgi:hypothetical protein